MTEGIVANAARRGGGATSGALALALSAALVASPALARAQSTQREINEAAGRAELETEVQVELAAVDADRQLAGELTLAGGVLLGVGLAGVLVGSIGTLTCADDACTPWYAAIGGGVTVAGVGIALFIAATVIGDQANDRRRRLLLEHLAIAPGPDGLTIVARGSF